VRSSTDNGLASCYHPTGVVISGDDGGGLRALQLSTTCVLCHCGCQRCKHGHCLGGTGIGMLQQKSKSCVYQKTRNVHLYVGVVHGRPALDVFWDKHTTDNMLVTMATHAAQMFLLGTLLNGMVAHATPRLPSTPTKHHLHPS